MPDKESKRIICSACGMSGMSKAVGQYRAIQVNDKLYDSDVVDADALSDVSEGFKSYVLEKNDGMISKDCLNEYLRKEMSQPASPLSKLFASRVRGRRCKYCGHISRGSRGSRLP